MRRWIKDKSLADSDNLPHPDELAKDTVANLESALDSFREMITQLKKQNTITLKLKFNMPERGCSEHTKFQNQNWNDCYQNGNNFNESTGVNEVCTNVAASLNNINPGL